MFSRDTYVQRRAALREALGSGLVLLLGNEESPMNYTDNAYPFFQDTTFRYYAGLDRPGLAVLMDLDAGRSTLYGYDFTVDDVVWMGPQPALAEEAERVGVGATAAPGALGEDLAEARAKGRTIHVLPPYRDTHRLKLARWLDVAPEATDEAVSEALVRAVIAQRSVKSDEEVAEIENALGVTRQMHHTAMRETRPGRVEQEVVGAVTGVVRGHGRRYAYPIIFSTHGETLHNHHYGHTMREGDLVVHDSGATSPEGYASDITRTIPVGGRFTEQQRAIYELVLEAEERCIEAVRPGVPYRDLHLLAARILATGLKDLGLMRGDVDEAVAHGAHALFFPHGLGHMIGYDVHDMEGLGEDRVGYSDAVHRSSQFGLKALRLGRALEPGFVLTVEPGLYFIPALIDQWQAEERHLAFIDYDALAPYRDFGGVRIEDNVLVTSDGYRVLGEPIAKSVADVEAEVGRAS